MAGPRSRTQLQARKLRDVAFEFALRLADNPQDESLKDVCRSLDSIIRAWENASERERIAAGRPLPGSIRPEKKIRRRRQVFGPIVEAAVPDADNKPV